MDAQARSYELVRKVNKDAMSNIYKSLNLTEEQKRSLEQNRRKHHGKLKSNSTKVKQLKLQINQELEKSNFDQEKVKRLKTELNRHQSGLTNTRIEGIINVREILTTEQYDLFNNLTK